MNELLEFQNFSDKEQATLTAALLEKNGIEVEVVENPPLLDSNFLGQQFYNPFSLKIPGASFIQAQQILMEQTEVNIDEVDKDYILFSLSNEELDDVLENKETWGVYNYKLALQILASRNGSSSENEVKKAVKLNLEPDAQPKEFSMFWIGLAYLCIAVSIYSIFRNLFFIGYLFPNLAYVVFGYILFSSKTTLANGKRIPTHSNKIRIHGYIIFGFGVVFLLYLFAIIFKIIPLWNS